MAHVDCDSNNGDFKGFYDLWKLCCVAFCWLRVCEFEPSDVNKLLFPKIFLLKFGATS